MCEKFPVIKLWRKMLSVNHNAGFIDQEWFILVICMQIDTQKRKK